MRMNYKLIPTDYYEELCNKGIKTAKKAEGFLSYCVNGELGHYHSVRYYSTRWEVSPSTAHGWIKEFDYEIDLWASHWQLKNNKHYSSVKKLTEQTEHLQPNKPNTSTCGEVGLCLNTTEQTEHLQPNKALNQYDDDDARMYDKLFTDLFNVYNMNTDFPGSRVKAYEQYMKMCHTVKHTELIQSAVMYLHDPKREGKLNNLANFLKNEVHINYMPKYIRVFTKGEWLQGVYDRDNETFTGTNGEQMKVLAEVFTRKFIKGEIEFISEIAA